MNGRQEPSPSELHLNSHNADEESPESIEDEDIDLALRDEDGEEEGDFNVADYFQLLSPAEQ